MHNVMQFTDGEFIIQANVSVYSGKERIYYFNDVTIQVSDMSNYYNVNIPWEDIAFSDYRSLGLFGYYSTGYNQMYYSQEGQYLRIESSNPDRVIVLDKI